MAALENFRANLRSRMAREGVSQRVLADRAGVHYTYINRVLAGAQNPSIDICERLGDAIGATVAELVQPPKKNSARSA